ncbi:MAG TPA: glutamate synthase large subunit [Acidimicrobiales bacterium]|nr:glutamate synthase large subunit [Acidimicrobiales bacterium]
MRDLASPTTASGDVTRRMAIGRSRVAGLYDPTFEHDGCGVASVAHLSGEPSHETVRRALVALVNMSHRGAEGADARTGDGAGILLQLPDELFRAAVEGLPPAGRYGVATCFLPRDRARREAVEHALTDAVEAEGQSVVAWRDVPVAARHLGEAARRRAPVIRQLFVGAAEGLDQDAFERKLYVVRRTAEKRGGADVVVPSFSSRTVVYKGMLVAHQLAGFYPDLTDPRCRSALALVHSRFSTNTMPSWELAHPYRRLAHNGEVNTLLGNVNWMRARQAWLASELFGDDLAKVLPVPADPDGSDSAILDNVLELLTLAGRSLPHAVMMMIPEAYEGRHDLPEELRHFFAFHSFLMEPWDGPASVSFTDGRVIGATLDRNGLRPGRWVVTGDGWVVVSSEAGALPVDPATVVRKGRLRPGKLFVVDVESGTVSADGDAELAIARRRPYGSWLERGAVHLDDLPSAEGPPEPSDLPLLDRQLAFGYTREDLEVVVGPMVDAAKEPTGSMGDDAALAVLSDQRPPLFRYFKQRFAQVTNPAIDPERESIVMSLTTRLGPMGNLLEETADQARAVVLPDPVLTDFQLSRLRRLSRPNLEAATVDCTWPVTEGADGLSGALERIRREAAEAVTGGAGIVVLSDRATGPERVPVPALLATGAVHHHLVGEGCRLGAGLVVESGEPREVHHIACLIGYGAGAVNPYLMLETVRDLAAAGVLADGFGPADAEQRALKAIAKGLLKIISKMGISTIQSYCGAQIFEAVGLDRELVDAHFTGTPSRIGGVGLDVLGAEAVDRHRRAWPTTQGRLPDGGVLAWRRDGERHIWNPTTVTLLQDAVRNGGGRSAFTEYTRAVDEDAARRCTLRGLLELRTSDEPLPLDEVEPAAEIVRHFATGAMSLGSISPEAHETLAVAMNRIGAKSNTGEGGEDPRRWVPDPNGDSRRSAIKQVASARFGVTVAYLVEADELQIKICQGSKPGEGGQLPGQKVSEYIAHLRHSTPGVELISPPPHHDIYSIEDLKQLIYDLRCANPSARVSVKLAAEVGVGTVAAGVAKAGADHVVIAGHDGGTGASPVSSITSAGVPWELGLAETQQVLVENDLRSRITVQADGQMKTGRDVVVAALLGAEEMGFSTAPLIATGCIMMRVCHLNTCPVGIATQDDELRRRFAGTPDHVVTFFFLLAQEVRTIMAGLGVGSFADLVGRADLLEPDGAVDHWKARGVDLSDLLVGAKAPSDAPRRRTRDPEPIVDAFDVDLMAAVRPAVDHGVGVQLVRKVRNVHRTVGGLLSGEIARARGDGGLPAGTIRIHLEGSAGQSLAAWLAPGVEITVRGEANDYVGKGLSGGVVAVRPPETASFAAEDNVIAGNTVLYGATGGKAFFRGLVGERFAVRNSGASAVAEGVGDHGCEYMTGGCVVVLGPTGRNFAAGMSGGEAYVLDRDGSFADRCNLDLVDLEDVGPDDAAALRSLVDEHRERTGSAVAERVLEQWEETLPLFRKVMPRDYKRVLEERAARAADGGGEDGEATPSPAAADNGQPTTSGPVAVGATADA